MDFNNMKDEIVDSQGIKTNKMKLIRFTIKNKANKPFLYFRGENILKWFGVNVDSQDL